MRELDGRVAVVTGAAGGIGRAPAGRFAAAGTRRVLAGVEEDPPADVPVPPPSSFQEASTAALAEVRDGAPDPDGAAGAVVDAVRARRSRILTHPEESDDMLERQLRWMRANEPLLPGPGAARGAGVRP